MAASRATILRNCNSSAAAFHQRLSLLRRSYNPQSAVASVSAAAKPISFFSQELMSYEGRPSDNQSKPSFNPAFSHSASVAAVCGVDVLRYQMGPPPSGIRALARAPKKVAEEEELSDQEVDDDDDCDSDEDFCEDDSDEDFSDDFSGEDSCDDVSDEDDFKK